MSDQTQQLGPTEAYQAPQNEAVEKSNLSPTAKLVNGMMTDFITPVLRESTLNTEANALIREKVAPADPRMEKFIADFKSKINDVRAAAIAKGCDQQQLAVIDNYSSKFIANLIHAETPNE